MRHLNDKDYSVMKKIAVDFVGEKAVDAMEAFRLKRKNSRGSRVFWALVDSGDIEVMEADDGFDIITDVKMTRNAYENA